jgi:UTP-glucose-1-phosphate uridylyltransferase
VERNKTGLIDIENIIEKPGKEAARAAWEMFPVFFLLRKFLIILMRPLKI